MTAASSSLSSAAAMTSSATIFDNVAAILRERYYDKLFREEKLPALIDKYRPAPGAPSNLKAERLAAERFLAQVPASHLGLLSEASFQYLAAELIGQPQPTFGFQAARIQEDYFT